MELDKWQQRQARQLAEDEGVSYEDAVARLFPSEAPAAAEAEAPAAKLSTSKAAA